MQTNLFRLLRGFPRQGLVGLLLYDYHTKPFPAGQKGLQMLVEQVETLPWLSLDHHDFCKENVFNNKNNCTT
jgi:hypothetical protein